jgi:hypothetical protein
VTLTELTVLVLVLKVGLLLRNFDEFVALLKLKRLRLAPRRSLVRSFGLYGFFIEIIVRAASLLEFVLNRLDDGRSQIFNIRLQFALPDLS